MVETLHSCSFGSRVEESIIYWERDDDNVPFSFFANCDAKLHFLSKMVRVYN